MTRLPRSADVPRPLRDAADAFHARGAPLYLVGGWPRNALLNLPPGDLDLGSALPPEEASAVFASVPFLRVADRDTRMGTLGVVCDGALAEYTPFRTESYGGGGAHRPESVRFGASMQQDALRRDFTVNALYFDIRAGAVEDPLGGLADLEGRLLRCCRQPRLTFADDGLRLMRLARFAGELGFSVERETYAAAAENAALLADIAPERVQAELNRILLADVRYPGPGRAGNPVLAGLLLLDGLGLLDVVVAEFAACRGVRQRADYHDFDVLGHLLHTAACAPPDLTLRLAGLLHDVGKPAALAQTGGMVGHDRLGEGIARAVLNRLRYPNAVTGGVAALVRHHMADLDGRMGEKRLRLLFAEMGRQRAWQLVELRRADVRGSRELAAPGDPAEKWAALLERMDGQPVPWTISDLAVDGTDVASVAGGPSPLVGELLRALHRHAVLHPGDNTRERLMRLAKRMAAEKARRKE